MSCDEIETRYCRYIEEVVNHRHLDRLTAYLTPDVIVHAPGVAPGPAGARQVLAGYFRAFPDFHLRIDAVLALDGDLLARLCATGTHDGVFLGLAPTGTRVTIAAAEAWRLRDGQCAEHWLLLDVLGLLQQLGAVPFSEPAAQPGSAGHAG